MPPARTLSEEAVIRIERSALEVIAIVAEPDEEHAPCEAVTPSRTLSESPAVKTTELVP